MYDGWNLIAVVDSGLSLQISYNWGLDVSGTTQGAGGVGGLLVMSVNNGPEAGTYYYNFDGNGNVMTLLNAVDTTLAAQYEYGPFGELIRATGRMAKTNPFRFSTKYQDDESDFHYYGYRYYSPSTGRWLSRDLIGERGGVNTYAFVRNDPANSFDALGLWRIYDAYKAGSLNLDAREPLAAVLRILMPSELDSQAQNIANHVMDNISPVDVVFQEGKCKINNSQGKCSQCCVFIEITLRSGLPDFVGDFKLVNLGVDAQLSGRINITDCLHFKLRDVQATGSARINGRLGAWTEKAGLTAYEIGAFVDLTIKPFKEIMGNDGKFGLRMSGEISGGMRIPGIPEENTRKQISIPNKPLHIFNF